MADIEYTYKSTEYNIKTYDNVLKTYKWISNCIDKTISNNIDYNVSAYIEFSSNGVLYSCQSIEEFKKMAFGKKIKVSSLLITARKKDNSVRSVITVVITDLTSIWLWNFFKISSSDELLILKMNEELKNTQRHNWLKISIEILKDLIVPIAVAVLASIICSYFNK